MTKSQSKKGYKLRELTEEESFEILKPILEKDSFIVYNHHHKTKKKPNTFMFTIQVMSLELLISVMEHERVKNVYFVSSVPPPGVALGPTELRYKVFVEYRKKRTS